MVTREFNGPYSHPPALTVLGKPQTPTKEGCTLSGLSCRTVQTRYDLGLVDWQCYYTGTMIKAVLFDMYGTLVGFEPSRFEVQSEACRGFGIRVTPEGIVRGYAVADAYMTAQNAVDPVRLRDPKGKDEFFGEYERLVLEGSGVEVTALKALEIFRRVRQIPYSLAPFDDVLPALKQLRERGLTLAMITNIDRDGGELVGGLGLGDHLDFTVTSAEVNAEKPHPSIFRKALERAGAEAQEAVHVGDQPASDVEGAMGVGINAVLLDRDGNHLEYIRCPRIESLAELPALLSLNDLGAALLPPPAP